MAQPTREALLTVYQYRDQLLKSGSFKSISLDSQNIDDKGFTHLFISLLEDMSKSFARDDAIWNELNWLVSSLVKEKVGRENYKRINKNKLLSLVEVYKKNRSTLLDLSTLGSSDVKAFLSSCVAIQS